MGAEAWSRMTLGEFVTLQRGHDLPEQDRQPGSVPVLGSFGITGWHDEAKAPGPGVTVGRSGASFGVVSFSKVPYWPLNTALYVIDFHGNDERFAYYFLKQFDFSIHNSGSAQPSLNRNLIHPLPVVVPPLREQKAIATLLGSLDDKIDLNRRMNQTLEAMAQAIFRSWFVDFDPVRAKAAGRKPEGMDAETAKLFPSLLTSMEGSELPLGWRRCSIYELASVDYGAPFSSKLFNAEGRGLPLIRIRDLTTHEPEIYTPETLERQTEVLPGDIVVGMDGEFRVHHWRGVRSLLNQRVCRFTPRSGVPSLFVSLSLVKPLRFFESTKTGTTVIHLGKGDIDTFIAVHPGEDVLKAFGRIVDPLLGRALATEAEARTLRALRDTLLPKLLSGEIRVKEAKDAIAKSA